MTAALGLGSGDTSATPLWNAPARSLDTSESMRFGAAKASLAEATAREAAMRREHAVT